MKDLQSKVVEEFDQLTTHDQAKILIFAGLLVNCPGFKAELAAITPAGQRIPPFEVVEALMNKWMQKEAAV